VLKRLGRLVTARPGWVIALVLLVTAALAPFILRLRIEANLTRVLPEDDPDGRQRASLTASSAAPTWSRSSWRPGHLPAGDVVRLDSLAGRFSGLAGVNGVQSLTTLQDVKGVGATW